MIITIDNTPIYRKANGTYVMTRPSSGQIDFWCGFPGDPDGCHAEVEAYLASLTPEEREKALIPEPVPPPPSPEQLAVQRRQAILAEITALDAKTIRPLRAGELDRVAEIEAQVVALRTELAAL